MKERVSGWRVADPGEEDAYSSGRTLTHESGRVRVVKEFFADGPSLFTYVVYVDGGRFDETTTLTQAKVIGEKVVRGYYRPRATR